MFCLCIDFQLEIVEQYLFSFSYVDLALWFGEFYLFVGNLDFWIDLKHHFQDVFLKYFFSRLNIIFHFPVPRIDIPYWPSCLWFLHQLLLFILIF